jgi:hypothetical protein
MEREVITTHIVLIPKKHPTLVTEFRPSSLCNVMCKIISNLMANRLKHVLPYVVSHNQSALSSED